MRTYHTYSSKETQVLAAVLAEKIISAGKKNKSRRGASVVALKGDLGAGKTTFTQGFLKALGARGRATSPTFVLMKRFRLGTAAAKKSGFTHIYHIDAYRFRAPRESNALGLKEIFQDPLALVVIEWPERLAGLLPRQRTSIRFMHGKQDQERVIIAA